ncbi:hypothetical protein V1478_008121 [Vespula squamosa]|uniref:Uncharacterized protein n=1 Tax=Vespula squamosa TaxID=30214 RepID=A0ABD2AXV3_VESSQ
MTRAIVIVVRNSVQYKKTKERNIGYHDMQRKKDEKLIETDLYPRHSRYDVSSLDTVTRERS